MIDDSWAAVMASPEAPWNQRDLGLTAGWPSSLTAGWPSALVKAFWSCRNARLLCARQYLNRHRHRYREFYMYPNSAKPPPSRSQYLSLTCKAFAAYGLTPEDVKCYLSNRNYSHLNKSQEDKPSTSDQNFPVAGDERDNKKAQDGISKKKKSRLASKSTNIANTEKRAIKYEILPSTRIENTKKHDTKGKTTRIGNTKKRDTKGKSTLLTKGNTKNRDTEGKILPVVHIQNNDLEVDKTMPVLSGPVELRSPEKEAREHKPCIDAFRSKSKSKRLKPLEYDCKSMIKKARRSYEDLKSYKTKPDNDNKDECPSNDQQDMAVVEDDIDNENDTSVVVDYFRMLTRGIEGDVSYFSTS